MDQLKGKVAVVSGATTSIGSALAIRFAREGASTALIDTDEKRGAEIVAQIEAAGGTAAFFRADVSVKGEAKRAMDEVASAWGNIYVLANCSWRQQSWTAFVDKPEDEFAATFDLRAMAAVRCIQAVFPHMKESGGRIINVASPYGATTYTNVGDDVAADWALQGITRAAAVELARYNILTNYLSPAVADIPEFREYRAANNETVDRVLKTAPLRRVGDPVEDIGGAAMYLVSDEACFVNGHPIYADGGQFLNLGVFSPGLKL